MLKYLLRRHFLMNEAGDGGDGGGGAPAAAPAATDAPAPAASDLMPPESLLNDKPEADAKPEGEGEKPAENKEGEKPAEDKPIKYEAFTLPEGVTIDEEKLGAFKELAAANKIPQDVAQQLVDIYAADIKQLTEAPYRAWSELQTKWQEEIKNDPVIGGADLDKNLAATKAGLKNLLGEDSAKFFEALNITGAGNNPDIVRALFKAAAQHAPATPVRGNPGGGTKSAGATLYPQMAGLGNGHEG
ncbi:MULTISPECIES: hypothetical protein [Ralstonia]|uniref:Peptidase n=1 Tax=Ralstonia condita TaxID=3058600 RepID=A0ABM9J0X5_9RALS|nr:MULTISPECIES: hypothetical protein [Ralstonia]MBB0023635.1 hypothetical protein [Ralstonia pickettii]MBB0097006.1 hypothetical protein [Ralstonia pickettii]MBB0107024.1 hypothetical protein [Ralstonia pickettii]MBB0127779.1 hypothetical protein [Ralstonia pickettii]MBB0160724.1 hypothetical protein [Ralstonia pickettii]